MDLLKITSPVRGEVTTWDLKRLLPVGRPLMAGQRILQIADTSDAEWELVTYLPEKELGHFLRKHLAGDGPSDRQDLKSKNIKITYILLNDPDRQLEGTLVEMQRAAELREEAGVCYRMRVEVDKDDLQESRPGAEVIARVHCGKRRLGFVLFHDAWEWVQTNLFF
jgi:hypothetical protein